MFTRNVASSLTVQDSCGMSEITLRSCFTVGLSERNFFILSLAHDNSHNVLITIMTQDNCDSPVNKQQVILETKSFLMHIDIMELMALAKVINCVSKKNVPPWWWWWWWWWWWKFHQIL